MDCKVFGRKLLRQSKDSSSVCAWRRWGKSRGSPVQKAYITAGIRTLYLSNTSIARSISCCCTVILIKWTEEPQGQEKIECAEIWLRVDILAIIEYFIFRYLTHLYCWVNVATVGNSSQFHMKVVPVTGGKRTHWFTNFISLSHRAP